MKRFIFIFLLSCSTLLNAQTVQDSLHFAIPKTQKGKFFAYWGWNRGFYSNSNMHFTGKDYDFKLEHVKAKDRQTDFDFGTYFNPKTLTIPQTNFRMGYFFRDNLALSLGFDHMKYVMVARQEVKIDGYIHDSDTQYNGNYDHQDFQINPSFLQYEHTDGLNFINLELMRQNELFYWRPGKTKIISCLLGESIGAGFLMPRSDVTLLHKERRNKYHISGYGISSSLSLNLTFFEHFFVQSELKGGFIHLPDVKTTESQEDKASQHFFFLQPNVSIGGIIRLCNRGK